MEYDINEGHGIMIPPLIIQPLVENAVIHGIRGKQQSGIVKLSIKREETGFLINVWDNGKGISKDKIQQLLDVNTSSKSVGLKNINMRLKRLYNTEIKITSTEGVETLVSVFISNMGVKEKNESNCSR